MTQEISDLFDEFGQGRLDRREFLKKVTRLAGGATLAAGLLVELEARPNRKQKVTLTDPQLETGYLEYKGETGKIRAYQARPKGSNKKPAVIVIHENRGLVPHIEDVTRRVALEGFIAIAPDALSLLGGTPKNLDEGRTLMGNLDGQTTVKNFVAAVKYLKTHPQTTGKVGCIGFCWGGAMTNQVAIHSPDLNAATPFYGRTPDPADVSQIKAAMLCHFAGLDDRINTGIKAFESALKAASVNYQIYIYEGAAHAFFNDTNPERYHRESAELAWNRTITFLKSKLK